MIQQQLSVHNHKRLNHECNLEFKRGLCLYKVFLFDSFLFHHTGVWSLISYSLLCYVSITSFTLHIIVGNALWWGH